MQASLDPLRRSLERFGALTDADWVPVAAWVVQRTVSAGEHLLRAGEKASQVLFVHRGMLREYYVDRGGTEATRRFCPPGDLTGSLADLISCKPALCSIDALEPSDVWCLDWARCDALSRSSAAWMLLLRRIAESLYLRKIEREFELLTLSAAERYRRFAERFPALASNLSRQRVASYLGITPVHLSRIRSAERSMRTATARRRRS